MRAIIFAVAVFAASPAFSGEFPDKGCNADPKLASINEQYARADMQGDTAAKTRLGREYTAAWHACKAKRPWQSKNPSTASVTSP